VDRRKWRGEGRAVGEPNQYGSARSNRVEHGADVVHALLERGWTAMDHSVGETHATAVEPDQPAEGAHPSQHAGENRVGPFMLDVADPSAQKDDVDWAAARHLISDVRAIDGSGVQGLGKHALIVDADVADGRN
jgi:hypothetical protein